MGSCLKRTVTFSTSLTIDGEKNPVQVEMLISHLVNDTVDGKNPAPPGIYKPCK